MLDHAKIKEKIEEYDRFEKNVRNAVLEEAAKVCDKYESYGAAYEIRTMKKMIPYGTARYIITKTELKELYNEAIEKAALIVQPNPHVDEERECGKIAEQIRKLKK